MAQMQRISLQCRRPGLGRSPEEGMATHCSTLAWRVPIDRGAWWATVHGASKSQTRLKLLSTHTVVIEEVMVMV